MQSTPRKHQAQIQTQLLRPPLQPNRKIGRWFVFVILFVILLPFISEKGLFRVQEISLSGNYYCTESDIYAIVDSQRDNVLTLAAKEIETNLKRRLTYLKQVHISKNVVRRSLDIQITEREPFALLKCRLSDSVRYVLVDLEGYVLEYKQLSQVADAIVVIVADTPELPELGDRVRSDPVQLGLRVMRSAFSQAPEVASRFRSIDAKRLQKIVLQLDELPTIWLGSDSIEMGLHHIRLFLEQRKASSNTGKPNSNYLDGYLDVRFEDAIYRGGGT